MTEFSRFGIEVQVHASRESAARVVAARIDRLIRSRAANQRTTVLGLATGHSPVEIYRELVRRHREEGLSFASVETFNLDEYYPIDLQAEGSFHRFMHKHLFDQVDLPRGRRHVPNGAVPDAAVVEHCTAYERAIRDAGGVDLQLLGIGRNGHIGFNEPGSSRSSRTRKVRLHPTTLEDNAADFADPESIPRDALTMGVGTILEAREILVLAFGAAKAEALAAAMIGSISESAPASFLREHARVTLYCDATAAHALRRSH